MADLLAGCLGNQRQSQELLYKQFYGYAMSICLRYTRTREEALDVLNDGFLKVFTKLDQYNPELPFKAWVRRIMINTALDHYRQAVHHQHADLGQATEHVPASSADAYSQLAYEELLGLIGHLSPAYRLVFNLYVIDGYSHEEIATQLTISVGTSKSNLARARENLRAMLQKKTNNEYAKVAR
ncbi:MAG: RNA polymerase sigma factor [Bacteroidetes bacterium]|nr:RNA polymerase sigma factor [Fibrella sp.]